MQTVPAVSRIQISNKNRSNFIVYIRSTSCPSQIYIFKISPQCATTTDIFWCCSSYCYYLLRKIPMAFGYYCFSGNVWSIAFLCKFLAVILTKASRFEDGKRSSIQRIAYISTQQSTTPCMSKSCFALLRSFSGEWTKNSTCFRNFRMSLSLYPTILWSLCARMCACVCLSILAFVWFLYWYWKDTFV